MVVGLLLAGCVVIVASGVAEVGGGRLVAVGGHQTSGLRDEGALLRGLLEGGSGGFSLINS